MRPGLPEGLARAIEALDASRRRRGPRWQPAEAEPREAAPPVLAARHRPPDEAAKASPRALADQIKGDLPWWARD